jgi:hypothetical protein
VIGTGDLIAVSGSGVAVFMGGQPKTKDFRVTTAGFIELASISHLGPAMASLVKMAQIKGNPDWKNDAKLLKAAVQGVAAVNTEAYWACLNVSAWAGRTADIATMVAYACDLTNSYLDKMLTPSKYQAYRTFAGLSKYSEVNTKKFPRTINEVMIATFTLTAVNSNSAMID